MNKFTLGLFWITLNLCWAPLVRADAVTDWNANAEKATIAACLGPTNTTRMYAMVHIAIHDALNAIDRRFKPYVMDLRAPSEASVEAAVATAAHDVLVPLLTQISDPECLDAGVGSVEEDYTAALDAIASGTPKTQGVEVGQAAAAAILALRAADGADTSFAVTDYPQGTKPGEYRFTLGTGFVVLPGWQYVTPFVLDKSSQFRPGPPYKVTSPKYTADFNEVKALGAKDSRTRTIEQTQIGYFWLESKPLLWNRITRTVTGASRLDVREHARLFALVNMALADGYIGVVEAKIHYNFWRPITAIQPADTDGNPDTNADPAWEPLQTTAPSPEYDSGDAVESGAASEVLRHVLETDRLSFNVCSRTLPLSEEQCGGANEVLRSYASFSQAADEDRDSRIYVGIHFRKSVEEGLKHGRKIGKRAVEHFLKPAD
jgi:hypothetical protein